VRGLPFVDDGYECVVEGIDDMGQIIIVVSEGIYLDWCEWSGVDVVDDVYIEERVTVDLIEPVL
jgi:hypothetical protein